MRPQQQNRRMRGRGGNNNNNNNGGRRGPNPLNRSYESNGPDVKIRGTAQQIADKYTTLARDAQSSGDRVMAENYLQHAEHYNRIIAAAQAQNPALQNQAQASRDNRDEFDEEDDREDRDERENSQQAGPSNQSPQKVDDGSGPQPVIDGVPVEVALKESNRSAAGTRSNGRDKSRANGADDKPQPAEADASEAEASKDAQQEGAEEKPKPRRPRKPRAKKAAEPAEADTGEVRTEEAAAAE